MSAVFVGKHEGPWTRTPPIHSVPTVRGTGRIVPVRSTLTGRRTVWSDNRVMSNPSKEAEFCISTDTLTCSPTLAVIGAALEVQELAPGGTRQTLPTGVEVTSIVSVISCDVVPLVPTIFAV